MIKIINFEPRISLIFHDNFLENYTIGFISSYFTRITLVVQWWIQSKKRLLDHWVLGVLILGFFPAYTTKLDLLILNDLYFSSSFILFYSCSCFFFFASSICLKMKLCPSLSISALLLLKSVLMLKNIGPISASQWGSTMVTQFIYSREVMTNSW